MENSFNTTLVTVLFGGVTMDNTPFLKFQYNPCYCSITRVIHQLFVTLWVSIQPLLLFYMTYLQMTMART